MKQEKHFVVDILFVLALFAVFTVSALVLVTIGADVYRHTVQDMSDNYDSRTTIAYITEKARQADCLLSDGSPAVELGQLDTQPALILTSEYEGTKYCTYLYLYEGYLKELYMRKDSYLGDDMLSAGRNILKLSSLKYQKDGENVLSVFMTPEDGKETRIVLSLRCR